MIKMKKKILTITILISSGLLLSFIKLNKPIFINESLIENANEYMWDNFHSGNYDSIPSILNKLHDAYREDPGDKINTAHLGFMYLWAFSERGRKEPDPSIEKNIYLSNRYFKEAIKLDPTDYRLLGFQSATNICEGALKQKWGMLAKGYIDGFKAINKWPQFNKFAFSIVESQRKKNTLMYNIAMKYQWDIIDECSCKKLTKKVIMKDPRKAISGLIEELKNTEDQKIKRVCWNSWIAPHNLEGFLLNFGDMLVKDGYVKEAKEFYSAIKFAPSYDEWVYKSVVNERIKNAEANSILFNKLLDIQHSDRNQIFINSTFSCSGCHQMSKKEFDNYKYLKTLYINS